MWAARGLPDCGPDAFRATTALRVALHDEDERVRVWARFALARITTDAEIYMQQLMAMKREGSGEAGSALEELARSPEQHHVGALCSAATMNDLRRLRYFASLVDVNLKGVFRKLCG
jgi:hypothetical protein